MKTLNNISLFFSTPELRKHTPVFLHPCVYSRVCVSLTRTAQSGGAKAAKRAPPPPAADMMEVAGSWEEEVFDNPQGAGSGSSTLTPLLAGSSSGQRSKPIRIAKNG